MPGEHLEENAAEAVDVAASIDFYPGGLLGTHVRRGPDGNAGSRQLLIASDLDRSSNSEVRDDGMTVRE
jgi:hypothetical protein